ncbi:uroporphyrinogen-III C-methyltransferase [Bradyrhizobium sp. dw_411]|uniref:uroporphyrinogen-III C-methyltransferase n=1 Tax=Bradyrhizobium sp. dw_411 TaxID=2720082 RepID=UPI001BD03B47|nr:uroporphyrinogen-III C-methyltransferase [Bradyrhizobium sp. dw_411]
MELRLPDFPDFPPGEVWLAGAGPGDPGLLTLYALHALQTADDIVHDALVDPRILELAGPQAKLFFAGKRGGKPSAQQADINDLLIERARMQRRVLRLKGGDPFVFGRGGEEVLALVRAGLRFRIIPGITSGLAAAALAGIPATTRDTNHAIILMAGSRAADGSSVAEWEKLARVGQPIIVYMPMANLVDIMSAFERGGMAHDTPAVVISASTTPEERVIETTLGTAVADAAREGIGSPAIVIVGAIASMRQQLLANMVGWP